MLHTAPLPADMWMGCTREKYQQDTGVCTGAGAPTGTFTAASSGAFSREASGMGGVIVLFPSCDHNPRTPAMRNQGRWGNRERGECVQLRRTCEELAASPVGVEPGQAGDMVEIGTSRLKLLS